MKTKTIPKISASWEPIGDLPQIYPGETYKMRKMQAELYKATEGKWHIIINAPTASGKTLGICWRICKSINSNSDRKSIIAVPQTLIADGFLGGFIWQRESSQKRIYESRRPYGFC